MHAVALGALIHVDGVRIAPRLASVARHAHGLAGSRAELGKRRAEHEGEHRSSAQTAIVGQHDGQELEFPTM